MDTVIDKGLVRIISARGLYEQFRHTHVEDLRARMYFKELRHEFSHKRRFHRRIVLEVETGKILAKGLTFNVVKTVQFSR